jgi:hypothetical protein
MTETLARVYLEQKKISKAIQAYEILILKYPEKSSFFADRIWILRFYNKIKTMSHNFFNLITIVCFLLIVVIMVQTLKVVDYHLHRFSNVR